MNNQGCNRLKKGELKMLKENEMHPVEEKLLDGGYEDVKYLVNFSYDDALIGVTTDNRAVYDYAKMVDWLMRVEQMDMFAAMEWIDYNTIRALQYMGDDAPIIMYGFVD